MTSRRQSTGSTDLPDLRRAILDETRHLLVKEGYTQLSMRKIARQVGCSATAIYLHFDGKDALVHALIDEGMDRLFDRLSGLGQREGDPEEILQRVCLEYVEFGLENPAYYEVMHLLRPERMARYPAEKYRRARRSLVLIQTILDRGVAMGSFAVESVTVTAAAIWSMLHGVVSLVISRRIDVRIDHAELISTLVRNVVRGVSTKPVPA